MTIAIAESFSLQRISTSRLLVAGLSGQVGRGLIEATAELPAPPHTTALVRRRARADLARTGGTAVQVIGDITENDWGLADSDLTTLGEVDAVVNLAGLVDWTASQATMDRINYLGAMNGLALARRLSERLGRTVPYLYVSTAYVAGTMHGYIPEDPHPPHADRTPYELSKWFAENHLLREAADGHPVLIARIGGVIGGSRSRSTTRWSSLYQLVAPMSSGQLPVLPVRPGARVDILPRDIIGEGLLRLVNHGAATNFAAWRGGAVVHLCAGEYAPTLAALLALLASKDTEGRYDPPRLVTAPDRALRLAENVGLKYARWNREMGNRLFGLRYVSIDRIFERTRLMELTDGWCPTTPVEDIIDIAFGLGAAAAAAELPELPLGRFA
ncbi:SDR family oxidoreductase [Nocardia concava]|uniref:SDR family oxidoreductase n=1 Tax=Nocardia concava TaxID=257281 RepID=UPI00030BA5CF|nr:SDR family oxidoreductase [Nocardia concava]